ncbi:hypothetical protein B0J13DRAFT_558446 [Dactylonectria estremocensis]|uniref:Terpene utilization protein AtuA n=1 Tax=Dactylonectria estremocensis TaxID=1079267 RepID=A0A9P9EKB9_9HYPO|nr:hypothetical protein B0J13DRAFT_558446 [Dactylonectria estremocensis]
MGRQIRIGCYSAFWGDTPTAARQLVEAEDGNLDYLVADYLAEVTMGLLARASRAGAKSSSAKRPPGYITEFATLVLEPLLPQILEKGIKVITNAGGLDPVGLKEFIEKLAAQKGMANLVKVAAVYGDDILEDKNELLKSGALTPFNPLNAEGADEPMFGETDQMLSLNAYIGAEAITKALSSGANIIVTGRCVDSALVLAPLAHEFSWDFARLDDQSTLDRLASASLAGHILECGAQATGGNFTDWQLSAGSPHGGWSNMGYPIATFREDGTFLIAKPANTGGLVTRHTVGEQMLYEVLDPENYILPDVVVDLSKVTLEQVDNNTVLVAGVRGKPPTQWLKCTAVRQTGYRTAVDLVLFGADAESKAAALGHAIVQRAQNVAKMELRSAGEPDILHGFESKIIVIGAEHSFSPRVGKNEAREVVVRVVAKHSRRHVLDVLSREATSFGTSSAPGITMLGTGRPKVSPNFLASSTLVHRTSVIPKLSIGKNVIRVPFATKGCRPVVPSTSAITFNYTAPKTRPPNDTVGRLKLLDIAVGRSGDKGDNVNIAFIARNPAIYPYLRDQVTPELMSSTLGHFLQQESVITRYDVPGVYAINFVVTKCLGGGGLDSLSLDRQGKGYAQICLASIQVDIPAHIMSQVKL